MAGAWRPAPGWDAARSTGTHLLVTLWKPEQIAAASLSPTAHRVQTEDDLGTTRSTTPDPDQRDGFQRNPTGKLSSGLEIGFVCSSSGRGDGGVGDGRGRGRWGWTDAGGGRGEGDRGVAPWRRSSDDARKNMIRYAGGPRGSGLRVDKPMGLGKTENARC
jgi:hypothetical protein